MAARSSTTPWTHHLLPLLLLVAANTNHAATFNITNQCSFTVWPAVVPAGGGMRLDPGKLWVLDVPDSTASGRVWARTGCSFDANGNGSCQTGDCGSVLSCKNSGNPPVTLAEFSLNQFNKLDLFDISLIQGFNVPMDFLPAPEEKQGAPPCRTNYQVIFCPPTDLTSSSPIPPAPTAIGPSGMESSSKRGGRAVAAIVASVIGSTSVLTILITCIIIKRRIRRNQELQGEEQEFEELSLQGMPRRFTLQQLQEATNQFRDKLGEGGFGSVFVGQIADEKVAVKRLDRSGQGMREFLAEIQTIGSIHHINLVRLIGFSAEKSQRLLVYEYMPKGSLDRWIYHQQDNKFNAKLSDFGLCKLIDRDKSQVITRMRGTPGYLAPEWLTSQITEKADVYSFGIVVMEIISGRKNLDTSRSEQNIHIITLLQEKVKSDQLVDMIDKHSSDMQVRKQEVIEMMKLAMWCLQIDCKRRPQMSEVVKVLEGTTSIETDIDHDFVATNPESFRFTGTVDSDPPLASDVSGPS
uniref:Protein kinase domain-containing protein n=1 Tax=Oryza punctata TaxID=4537 RepID=A0A0E0JDB6_ORYPU